MPQVSAIAIAGLAIVIAESRYIAEDALDDIDIELEQLPAVVDLEEALSAGAELIGVNNRDLTTFEVTLETSLRLAEHMPASAIRSPTWRSCDPSSPPSEPRC